VEKTYHIAEKSDSRSLTDFWVKNGQSLLPMVELIEQSQKSVDELIDEVGRATIEAVLRLSGEGIAGLPHPGKKGGAIGWHGRESGTVCLRERKLRVERPRLRKKEPGAGGEVPLPAYEAMRADGRLGSRMLDILLQGVSTRRYVAVLPQMAETVGVSKSSVSRQAVEASEKTLRQLCERRLEALELLILYVGGLRFTDHQVMVAVGVDEQGEKHVLGAGGRGERERAGGERAAGRSGAARAENALQVPVRDRWLEGAAGHD
jgi:putative transposase